MDDRYIGPYRIDEPLGQGAMGVVYRARRAGALRPVALKTVRVPSSRLLESLRREIQVLTRVRHPGVVRIVDHGVHHGRPWYAMDLLEGETLRQLGDRLWNRYSLPWSGAGKTECLNHTDPVSARPETQPTTPLAATGPGVGALDRPRDVASAAGGELRLVLRILRRVCATLAFLHGEGFVNCDLKPENILLVDGEPVIIDFGLTAQHSGRSSRESLEAPRGAIGTIPYMSPEQIRGEFVDARSDLYSVGCLLYELVTAQPPFTGPPRAVLAQHLFAAAAPPSALALDVPPELDRLILKLLEKNVADRFGHAAEVAAELGALGGEAERLRSIPPPRSFLYRPRFAGRDRIVAELARLRDRAFAGHGSLVLLGGESGAGKTRLAMELTRLAPGVRVQIVTSESPDTPSHDPATARPVPLGALRPLLQAVADRCLEGGPDVTEHLLGERRALLALYEPLLVHVPLPPAHRSSWALRRRETEASRQRLFRYLAETLARLANDEQPLFWILDDLGRADELSLAFLRSLSSAYFDATPLFILGTYRTEEATDAIATIARLPQTKHIVLPRLDQSAVHAMVGDMLAPRSPPPALADFIARQAEGNPFFVAEYLRMAMTKDLLYRDQRDGWRAGAAELGDGPAAKQDWSTLGHHFAAAGRPESAVRYLMLAADRARASSATGEAIQLYREAIKQVTETILQLGGDAASWHDTLITLHEALADLLSLGTPIGDARAA